MRALNTARPPGWPPGPPEYELRADRDNGDGDLNKTRACGSRATGPGRMLARPGTRQGTLPDGAPAWQSRRPGGEEQDHG